MFKIIGAFLIILGTVLIGATKIMKMKNREKSLRSICDSLHILNAEISDRLTPTDEAIKLVAQSELGPAAKFFENVYESMNNISNFSFSEIWSKAVDTTKSLLLNEKEKQCLKELGYGLGRYSSYEQKKLIEYCLRRLEDAHKSAYREVQRDSKVHAVLGAAAGLLVVIIFI